MRVMYFHVTIANARARTYTRTIYMFTRHIKDGDACSCVCSLLRFIYSVQETRISETTKAEFAGTATTNEMEEAFGNATVPRSVRRSFDSLPHRRAYSEHRHRPIFPVEIESPGRSTQS